ncbi:MAG: DUF3109 family protein [Bacteroidales bacterium]|nr:DUF3109 family protein [Bacteroidales bacterium]
MLQIGDNIFSLDILEKKFRCDLSLCKGNCCRYGDSGAPLTDNEVDILDEIWTDIKPYLRPEGVEVIEKTGTHTVDFENDKVTPLINGEECAYTVIKDGIFMCGIEMAFSHGKTNFRKPVSCHLFPVRIKDYTGFKAVNYQELQICKTAVECGEREEVYVYEFLKVPLIRALGKDVYNELCIAAKELRKKRIKSSR